MSLSKDRGGLSLPNLKLYYWSTIMTFCKALISRKQGLEVINETPTPQELVLGEDICGYLWRCPFDSYYKKVRFKTLSGIHNTWNNIRKLIGIGRLSYYTLISKNYNLPEPFRDAYMNRWVEAGITQLGHFFSGIGIKSFEELQRDYMLGNRDFFKYLQIRDFLLKKGGGRSEFQKVQVVELLNQNRPIKIGDIYENLLASCPDDLGKYYLKWQDILGISADSLNISYALFQSSLMSVKLQAQYYKTFFQLYYTPSKIAKWGDGKGTRCPRCILFKADITHIFATCDSLQGLIKDISAFLSEIFHCQVEISVGEILLGCDNNVRPRTMQALLFVSMAVLRLCIASAWLDPTPPAFQQWRCRILATCNLELAIYKRKGLKKKKKGLEIWEPLTRWIQLQC